ncbi:MAG: hypothetical protein AAGJ37_03860 [Pseudomonadota bacterium]
MVVKRYSTKQFLASIIFTACATIFVVNTYMDHTKAPCKSLLANDKFNPVFSTQPSIRADASPSCSKDNEYLSWLTWLTRTPESMQFYYLDLLELINGKH